MRVAVRKIDGVDSVEVSLDRGVASITFRPGNRVGVEQVRGAIRSNGFTPKEADVRVQGVLTEQNGVLVLTVPGEDRAFRLVDDPQAAGVTARLRGAALGKAVVVDGTIAESKKEKARGASPATVAVRSFSPAEQK